MSSSDLEKEFLKQVGQFRLPTPDVEFRFAKAVGRQHRFDVAWPLYKLAVECDGFKTASVKVPAGASWRMQTVIVTGHGTPSQLRSDTDKRNMAVMLGWNVLVFHESHIESKDAIAMTQRCLVVRGWKPPIEGELEIDDLLRET